MIEILFRDGSSKIYRSIESIPLDWIDFLSVQFIGYQQAELDWAQLTFGIDISILKNGEDIEISAHYQEKANQLSFHFSMPYLNKEGKMMDEPLFFVLKDNCLFSFLSLTMEDSFNQLDFFRNNLKHKKVNTINELLMALFDLGTNYFVEITEKLAKKIKFFAEEQLKKKVFNYIDLDKITQLNFNNIQIKESLIEFHRVLSLFKKNILYQQVNFVETINIQMNDLTVVSDYIQYNFDRLDDLRENITIKINLEQNNIFKNLTITTVCIAIPTFIAGVYGMNFEKMPELKWQFGYLFALVLMMMSVIFPILFFKKQKWF